MSTKNIFNSVASLDDKRPLPLIVAEKWNFPLQYHETDEGFLYAVQDWIAGLATTDNRKAAKMWNFMQRKLEMSSSTRQLKYTADDKKRYDLAFTDDEGLYQIAAYMRVVKSRPALRTIKDFLAKAGVFTDEARRDPEGAEMIITASRRKKYLRDGKSMEWIATRELGIITRKQLMAIVSHLLGTNEHHGTITNDTYTGVFGMTAQELRQHMNIPTSAVLRDYFGSMALVYTRAAEEAARIQLDKYDDDDIVDIEVVRTLISTVARLAGKQAREMSKMLGIDVVTGRPLLATKISREKFMSALYTATEPLED